MRFYIHHTLKVQQDKITQFHSSSCMCGSWLALVWDNTKDIWTLIPLQDCYWTRTLQNHWWPLILFILGVIVSEENKTVDPRWRILTRTKSRFMCKDINSWILEFMYLTVLLLLDSHLINIKKSHVPRYFLD